MNPRTSASSPYPDRFPPKKRLFRSFSLPLPRLGTICEAEFPADAEFYGADYLPSPPFSGSSYLRLFFSSPSHQVPVQGLTVRRKLWAVVLDGEVSIEAQNAEFVAIVSPHGIPDPSVFSPYLVLVETQKQALERLR